MLHTAEDKTPSPNRIKKWISETPKGLFDSIQYSYSRYRFKYSRNDIVNMHGHWTEWSKPTDKNSTSGNDYMSAEHDEATYR